MTALASPFNALVCHGRDLSQTQLKSQLALRSDPALSFDLGKKRAMAMGVDDLSFSLGQLALLVRQMFPLGLFFFILDLFLFFDGLVL